MMDEETAAEVDQLNIVNLRADLVELMAFDASVPWACLYTLVDVARSDSDPDVRADAETVYAWMDKHCPAGATLDYEERHQ